MKELTLKEWSAYLPYGLICEVKGEGENNGWIKIEESNDLPIQRGEFWFVSQLEKGKIVKAYFNPNSALDGNKAHYVKLYSHYQPIQKPEPPKF